MKHLFHSRKGFTLMEITVATAVGLIVLSLLLQVVLSNTKLWESSRNRIEAFREARALQESIQRDLTCLAKLPESPDLPILLCKAPPGAGADDVTMDSIYFLKRGSTLSNEELSLVGYFTRWDSTRSTYVMMRVSLQGDEIISRFKALAADGSNAEQVLFDVTDLVEDKDYGEIGAYIFNVKVRVDEDKVNYPNQIYSSRTLPKTVTLSFTTISPQATQSLVKSNIAQDVWIPGPDGSFSNQIIQRFHQNFVSRVSLR